MAVKGKKEEEKELTTFEPVDAKDVRFDLEVQIWINSSTVEKFKGHHVVPQEVVRGVSKFTGLPYYALRVYDKDEEIDAFIKVSRTLMRELVQQGIYSAEYMIGFEFVVDCVTVKIMGRDTCLPVLRATEDTLKKIKEMKAGEKK